MDLILVLLLVVTQLKLINTSSHFHRDQQVHRESRQAQIQVKIGGLFDSVDSLEEATLKLAVEQINRDPYLLPYHHLILKAETIEAGNSFQSAKAVCSLLREGIVGIFGPTSSAAAAHVQSLCDRYDIPHIETHWEYRTRQDKYAINIHPHPDSLGQAYENLVNDRNWSNFAVLFDHDDGLFKLQHLIRTSMQRNRNITVRRLPNDGDYRPVLKSLQRVYQAFNIIVDADVYKTLEVLRQAEQIGMISYDYSYILTTLDLQPADMDEYKHGEAKFFAFRLVDPEKPEVLSLSRELAEVVQTSRGSLASRYPVDGIPSRSSLTTAQALVFDAVKLFSRALHENSEMIGGVQPIHCDQNEGWTEGSTLLNDMRAMPSFYGFTGPIQFNNSGFRTDISLDLVRVTENGLIKAGSWEYAFFSNSRITWLKNDTLPAKPPQSDKLPLKERHLNVTTFINPPYCMYKLSEQSLEGNNRFEGFNIDLIDELSKRLSFNYTIQLVSTGDRSYAGTIEEVMKGVGHLAIGDLTITKDRQGYLDFTMPFMNLGISILFVPPQVKPPSLFSFMSPFALEVWIYMAFAFFGVSLVLFIVARLTPLEWDNPLPCITDPDKLQNQFKFSNSIWFTLGSIMQQGSDLAPKAVSTRIIAGIWWFFTLIMVSSYTANLATFLIVQDLDHSVNSLSDLAKHPKIQYGCVGGGSTANFFSNATDFKRSMWDKMSGWKDALKANNAQGIEAVLKTPGKYAFFMESTGIDYNKVRFCGLDQIGGLLDTKGYGIALPKGSPYLDLFNNAILKCQEEGKLSEMKTKWWEEQRKETAEICTKASAGGSVQALMLTNVGGVFVVLAVGCSAAVFITCLEILLHSRANRANLQTSQGESRFREIVKDLQFSLQCRGNVKPVRKRSAGTSLGNSKEELGSTPYMKYASNKSLAD